MIKIKHLAISLLLIAAGNACAQRIDYKEDLRSGYITNISINTGSEEKSDFWLLNTSGKQYRWITDWYQWGKGYATVNGKKHHWRCIAEKKYIAGEIRIDVDRKRDGNDVVETYTFVNTSKKSASLSNIGIYTPLNDNYPSSHLCMTERCNVHIWHGGKAAYVKALPMNGKGAALGLMVTQGEITDYDVWERGPKKGMSNFRGVFALCPPNMTLEAGESYTLQWRLFAHHGNDFEQQLLNRGGMIVKSNKYVYELGEKAKIQFIRKDKVKTITRKVNSLGDIRVDYMGTHALLLGVSGERELLKKRVQFILDNQQMNNPADPRYGAFMVYDNEGDSILTDCKGRSDLDEGRERVGMGIVLAEYAMRNPEMKEKIVPALTRYARFIREKIQDANYTTGSSVMKASKNRGYNYAWVADFYFRMALLTGNKQYALDGYGTLQALYRMFGYGFYCIDYPVTIGLKALKQFDMKKEYDTLLANFNQTGDVFVKNGLNFPKFEVNYEQSIVAPAVQFLSELYLVTGKKEYLDGATTLMPALEAFNGSQPSHRLHDIAIRHWDGHWFGKRQTYGDVFPHYWSSITAGAFYHYAKATGKKEYAERAKNICRGNLSLFSEDGRATCAFVYPRMVNGVAAHYADAYANDQDWALMFWMMVE